MTNSTLFPSLLPEAFECFTALERSIKEAVPLNRIQYHRLSVSIRTVWEGLTKSRDERDSHYLSQAESVSAYMHYFFPWNLYRFTRLFSGLEIKLGDAGVAVDLGSGPLTVITALWIAKPELRSKKITFYAVDRSSHIMEAGLAVLERLAVDMTKQPLAWKIIRVKERFGAKIKEKADFVSAAFVINELSQKNRMPFSEQGKALAYTLKGYVKETGSIMLLDAGTPRSSGMLSSIREALINYDFKIASPCPHDLPCPMPGPFKSGLVEHSYDEDDDDDEKSQIRERRHTFSRGDMSNQKIPGASGGFKKKTPWCHFIFDTQNAPAWLTTLSDKAGLPKESAALSFVYLVNTNTKIDAGKPDLKVAKAESQEADTCAVRIVSETFPLPDRAKGTYACTELGYSLVANYTREDLHPGIMLHLVKPSAQSRDRKSGAVLFTYGKPFVRENTVNTENETIYKKNKKPY